MSRIAAMRCGCSAGVLSTVLSVTLPLMKAGDSRIVAQYAAAAFCLQPSGINNHMTS